MFRRRQPIPFLRPLRGWLWPHIGWRRRHYLVKRLTRLPGTPHSIAAGFACGVAISFTPFIGLHTLLSAACCALLVRGNYLAAVVGTLVGNPWTFPFIWLVSYQLGHALLGGPAVAGCASVALAAPGSGR